MTRSCGPSVRRRDVLTAAALPIAAMRAVAAARPWKILLVVAHPDDEYYFAATVFRLAKELDAVVDQMIITNGEAGYRYSSLAEKVYGVQLTEERSGRSRLPEIRKQETLAAGRILGIRRHYFLDEQDHRFTFDSREALNDQIGVWDCAQVRRRIRSLLDREHYDFVFTMLPRPTTHGHHQAATFLALQVVAEMPEASRPVVLGAEPREIGKDKPSHFEATDLARTVGSNPNFIFPRTSGFGFQNALRYDIIVNWVIAEHKSQGLFQRESGRHDAEQFWRFDVGPADAAARTQALFHQILP